MATDVKYTVETLQRQVTMSADANMSEAELANTSYRVRHDSTMTFSYIIYHVASNRLTLSVDRKLDVNIC